MGDTDAATNQNSCGAAKPKPLLFKGNIMNAIKLAASAFIFAAASSAFATPTLVNDDAWIRNIRPTASAPAPVSAGGVVNVPQVNQSVNP